MVRKVNTMYLGLKIGLLIALPLVGFLLLGIGADKKFETFPLFFIIGIVSGFILAIYMVYRIIIPYINKKVNNNKNNK